MATPKLLRYPLDIINATTDYMYVEVLKYVAGGLPDIEKQGSGNLNTKGTKAIQSIILPMPNSIASVNRTGWGESNMSALAGAGLKAAGMALDGLTGSDVRDNKAAATEDIGKFMTRQGRGLVNSGARQFLRARIQASLVNAVAGSSISANDVFGRQSGQIVNQNVELLFNSVSIRPFGFNWDFTPRNHDESVAVLQIIKCLKRSAAPKKIVGQNGFLSAPDVFRLTYKRGTGDQRFLNKFKICALTSVGVDYTGSGIYASYHDGTPVHYRLNLSFTELEPIYSEDYTDANSAEY
jgi:hypothetical protein